MSKPPIELWDYVLERHKIWHRRTIQGLDPPWTDDPILQQYHFCNVRRRLDRGTVWYLNQIQDSDWGELVWRTILYRLINSVEWWERAGGVPRWKHWKAWASRDRIIQQMVAAGPIHSPAYITLPTPTNMKTRHERLWYILARPNWVEVIEKIHMAESLEKFWKGLQELYGVGPFVALQVFRDLIDQEALNFSEDDFTYIGPGAATAIELASGLTRYKEQYAWLIDLWENQPDMGILQLSLNDVEHNLCEWRKYIHWQKGHGKKRQFSPKMTEVSTAGKSTPV